MAIKYALYPNHLTEDPHDHMALVQDQRTRTLDDIVERMVKRGSTVTKADILSVLEDFQQTIVELVVDGDSINTDLFRITASISGVFANAKDSFDSSRHQINLNVYAGWLIQQIISRLTVEQVEAVTPRPSLKILRDITTGSINESLTPGGPAELDGDRLKFDPEDPGQGIFLISNGTETRAETIIRNMPGNLIFMVPDDIVAGEYQIEVRAAARDSDNIRKGSLDATLTAG